jgi:BirA family transcriptional regulator, biotin operon repressor / biotin---[acetyl-CoA-carboxylase] ligase
MNNTLLAGGVKPKLASMDLSQSETLVSALTYVDATGSTNADLALKGGEDLTVLVAGSQTAGRGRSGREWSSPVGSSLAVSILVRPQFEGLTWLPLLAGLAMTRAVRRLGADAQLKWPNDVLVGERKISGILTELVAPGVVVIGAGLNLKQAQDELPIPNATSLALEGLSVELPEALQAYLAEFVPLYRALAAANGNPEDSLRTAVREQCSTIGQQVRATMPGDNEVVGKAIDIDADGRLLINVAGENTLYAVGAGDIVHLRHN